MLDRKLTIFSKLEKKKMITDLWKARILMPYDICMRVTAGLWSPKRHATDICRDCKKWTIYDKGNAIDLREYIVF